MGCMSEFAVQLESKSYLSGGKAIRVACLVPQAAPGIRFPAVVALYGANRGFQSTIEPARELASHGFAVYVPDYFERTGTLEAMEKSIILRNFPAWMKCAWDCVSFVGREAIVDRKRLAIIGFSLGGYLALSNAVFDWRIRAVVDFFGGLPREVKPFLFRKLPPILIHHGDADQIVPVSEAFHLRDVLDQRRTPYEMHIYPGAGHIFEYEVWTVAARRTLKFLKTHLAAPVKPAKLVQQP